jgi:CheY-like chemotaxis protein
MDRKVLLIDDEASLRRSVSIGLMQKGYQTEPCESGMKALQALEAFKQKKIPLDCAIVDVKLPDIDGLKLLKVIKFNYPEIPVIIITGYGGETVAEEAKTADAYLEKPFTMEDLSKILEAIESAGKGPGAPISPPAEAAGNDRSLSAYAMISLDASANLLDTYRRLYFHENVLYCDATRGDYDLVLLLQAPTVDRIKTVIESEIRMMKGVSDVSLLSVETPVFTDNVINIMGSVDKALRRERGEEEVGYSQPARGGVSSYVMLEVEKEKMEAIYPILHFDDHVINCDCAEGRFNIVLLMNGTSFDEIGSTIRNKFRGMDGVLRLKELPIITLFET